MNRKQFVKQCGFACLGVSFGLMFLSSCVSVKSIEGKIIDTDLVIPLESFLTGEDMKVYKKYILIEHPRIKYPICVFRFSENNYSALLMQCTHQGAELQVFGDRLQCPAHGSEFDAKGLVQNGPANTHLRSFPVTITDDQIKISLKNV